MPARSFDKVAAASSLLVGAAQASGSHCWIIKINKLAGIMQHAERFWPGSTGDADQLVKSGDRATWR
jgi:hypothetical protein